MGSFIDLRGGRRKTFRNRLKEMLPEGGNLNLCLTCGACSAGCPAAGLEEMDPRKFVRMIALGMEEEVVRTPWVWMCTMCQRCIHSCPMKVNIPEMVYQVRQMWPREKRPKGILGSCDLALRNESGSAMGTPVEDWKFVVEDVLAEVQGQQPAWKTLKAPMDKEGAFFCLNQNSREPVTEPEEMVPLWKILHTVGADWTYPSKGWAGENYCMFLADDRAWEHVVRNTAEQVERLGSKVLLNTEWGHVFYAIRAGLQKFHIEHKFELKSIIQYYAQWIREGKLKVNSDWNREKLKFTVQDPCQVIRKSLGDPLAEDLRFVVKAVVGEENFIDMAPSRSNNFCCGGGGGFLQAGFTEARRTFGKIKFDQIVATGAQYCIAPCHNCHSQIHDLAEQYAGKYHTAHLWTLICLSLGVLAENERLYLGEDLKGVNLPNPNP